MRNEQLLGGLESGLNSVHAQLGFLLLSECVCVCEWPFLICYYLKHFAQGGLSVGWVAWGIRMANLPRSNKALLQPFFFFMHMTHTHTHTGRSTILCPENSNALCAALLVTCLRPTQPLDSLAFDVIFGRQRLLSNHMWKMWGKRYYHYHYYHDATCARQAPSWEGYELMSVLNHATMFYEVRACFTFFACPS